jgi:hypothetical protein
MLENSDLAGVFSTLPSLTKSTFREVKMAIKPIRPIRIEGNVAFVPITKGYETIIDAVDVHLVEGWNWCANVGSNTVYSQRLTPRDADGKQQKILMHRAIMAAPDHLEVDHENGNGLDNRRSANLRLATHAQNNRNQRISRANTSGAKGVSWDRRDKKWRAYITLGGKRKHLGFYTEIDDAAAAYAKASAEMHGEFGRTA